MVVVVVQELAILAVVVHQVRVVMLVKRDRRDDDLRRAGSGRDGRRGGAEAR